MNAGDNRGWPGDYCSKGRSWVWALIVLERWLGRYQSPTRMAAPQARGRIEFIRDKMAWSIWSHPRSDASERATLSRAPRPEAVTHVLKGRSARACAAGACMMRGPSGKARIASTPIAQVMMNLISVQFMVSFRFRLGLLPITMSGRTILAC